MNWALKESRPVLREQADETLKKNAFLLTRVVAVAVTISSDAH